jgi:broad specificity phosphatase PhoE
VSELILVRHGQASFGAESYDKLSPLGIEQVQLLAEHWQGNGEQFDHLYCGELLRQRETAALLQPLVAGSAQDPNIHLGLNEYDGTPIIDLYLRDHHPSATPVQLPILDRKEFQLIFEAATSRWIEGALLPQANDSTFEPWLDFQSRVHGVIDELMARHDNGSRVLVSTSGGVIALALQRVLGLPDAQVIAANWMVNNSSVTRIRYGGGRVSLALFNGLSHLEKPQLRDKITFR